MALPRGSSASALPRLYPAVLCQHVIKRNASACMLVRPTFLHVLCGVGQPLHVDVLLHNLRAGRACKSAGRALLDTMGRGRASVQLGNGKDWAQGQKSAARAQASNDLNCLIVI